MPAAPPPTRVLGPVLDPVVDRLVTRVLGADGGLVSVWLGGTDGLAAYAREAGATHYAASTMKLPLVVAAYRRHERGELDLETPVAVHDDFRSAYDGSTFVMCRDYDQDEETWD